MSSMQQEGACAGGLRGGLSLWAGLLPFPGMGGCDPGPRAEGRTAQAGSPGSSPSRFGDMINGLFF